MSVPKPLRNTLWETWLNLAVYARLAATEEVARSGQTPLLVREARNS
ncbi:hypothetical protein [Streptomyces sp. NPDC057494]